ncbi:MULTISPECIES: hypothetical protein [Bacillus]|uniref:hypothetical protein n=1 Tax=Bacillus TaxID=1386 RepID=UPI001E44B896|nr:MULTISPECIES: hypothetical protein [Bacillus]MCC8351421.1 hypothetical protein [Bacillus sp. AF23]MCK8100984.1 hypothetical protein [Bacillus sp. 2CMS4F]MEC1604324.1 hypothetical protein [Bacillus halotolerans]MEC1686492.1 hypothetical protein [Bacillus mojavensis]MEC1754244.1 hypothetical protein [Bacillus mojavensis]
MLNSEHFSKIQKALDATASQLQEAGAEFDPSAMTSAQEALENAVKHTHSTDHPFLCSHVNRK